MNQDLLFQVDSFVRLYIIPTLWKLCGALAVWIIGGWAIRLIGLAFGRFMRARHVDETIVHYLNTSAVVVLKLLTLIAMLGVLGIETTSFAALLAAAGLGIGAAWSGLLANFAAGLFLLSFRPFKVGDAISAAGTTGTVREIGLFMTKMDTPDRVMTYVPNNSFSWTISRTSAPTPRGASISRRTFHLQQICRLLSNGCSRSFLKFQMCSISPRPVWRSSPTPRRVPF
jgi:small conductance mechanosensitive channel